jgi:tetratricopeptide (TPR) repeat protein
MKIGGLFTRKVLVVTIALVLVAIVFLPAMGYTIQIGDKSDFSSHPGERINFTIGSGTPAHEITYQKNMAEQHRIHSFQSKAQPYSFRLGGRINYSINAMSNATMIVFLGGWKPARIGAPGTIGKGLAVSIEPENATDQAIGYPARTIKMTDEDVAGLAKSVGDINKSSRVTSSETAIAPMENATNATDWLNRAQALETQGSYGEALKAYEKALDLDANYKDALIGKARALGKLGSYNDALETYEAVIKLDSNYADAWMGKANALKLLGREVEAGLALAKAIELTPIDKPVEARNATSEAKNMTDEDKKAITAGEASTLAPNETIDATLKILGLDITSFPLIKVTPFVNTSCAIEGGLNKEDFSVMESDKSVEISNVYFSGNASGKSLDLAIVFDDTGSMQLDAMKSNVQGLIKQIVASGFDYRYSLITFKDKVSVRTNWTNSQDSIYRSINALSASGGSEIRSDEPENSLDGIEEVLSMGFRPDAQKIILVITDAHGHYRGDGTAYSKYTKEDVKRDLVNSGVVFIPISPKFKISTEFVDLRDISNETHSMWIDIKSAKFTTILENFRQMLTGTYVLEYTSNNLTPNTNRTITVTVDKKECAFGSASAMYSSPEKK